MRNWLYSDFKDSDYTAQLCDKLAGMSVAGIICDFEPNDDLCQRLHGAGIRENYYVLKLWRFDSFEILEAKIQRAKDVGFMGIAIDSEPYSVGNPPKPVSLWLNERDSFRKGLELGRLIRKYFNTQPVLYPEGMLFSGDDKYRYWSSFYEGLQRAGLNPTIFMERTYNQFEPWNLLYFYWSVKTWAKGKVIIGTWQTSFKEKWKAMIQAKFTKLFGERFLYTEGKEYAEDNFYSRIAQ